MAAPRGQERVELDTLSFRQIRTVISGPDRCSPLLMAIVVTEWRRTKQARFQISQPVLAPINFYCERGK